MVKQTTTILFRFVSYIILYISRKENISNSYLVEHINFPIKHEKDSYIIENNRIKTRKIVVEIPQNKFFFLKHEKKILNRHRKRTCSKN